MGAMKTVERVVYTGHAINVFLRYLVHVLIINTRSSGVVLLLDQHNRRCPWTRGRFDDALGQHFLYFFLDYVAFNGGNLIRVPVNQFCIAS